MQFFFISIRPPGGQPTPFADFSSKNGTFLSAPEELKTDQCKILKADQNTSL